MATAVTGVVYSEKCKKRRETNLRNKEKGMFLLSGPLWAAVL